MDARVPDPRAVPAHGKLYSPQFGLWLLPWFALALPNLRLFVAFQLTDVAVYVTEFSWLGGGVEGGLAGLPLGAMQLAILARAVVLVLCLVSWVRRREPVPTAAPPLAGMPPSRSGPRRSGREHRGRDGLGRPRPRAGRRRRGPGRGRSASGRMEELAAGAFRFCLLAFVGLRLAMLVVGVVSVALFPSLAPVGVSGWRAGPVDLGWQHAFAAWERFDALWFLRIADGGYRFEDGSAAFFPCTRSRSAACRSCSAARRSPRRPSCRTRPSSPPCS